MKRPLIPVALCYVGGLLLGEAVPVAPFYLFTSGFLAVLATLFIPRARNFLLWPLLVLIGWTNLVQRTAIISPQDLRLVIGNAPVIATVRGTLTETPSVRVRERQGRELAHTLVPLRITAFTTNDHWHTAAGDIVVATKGELPADLFAGREAARSGSVSRDHRRAHASALAARAGSVRLPHLSRAPKHLLSAQSRFGTGLETA